MTNHILIIDDDIRICQLIQKLLEKNNYSSFFVSSTKEAREIIKYIKFNLILVDFMMPEENGIDFINSLKNQNIKIPTLMISAIDEIDNKINALTQGAIDYITKPFNSQELLLKINNIITLFQLNNKSKSKVISIGDISFNTNTNKLIIANQDINLSTQESLIFKILINRVNQTIYKEEILKILDKVVNEHNINTLNVSIMRLRKKVNINEKILKTVRGKGFVLSID